MAAKTSVKVAWISALSAILVAVIGLLGQVVGIIPDFWHNNATSLKSGTSATSVATTSTTSAATHAGSSVSSQYLSEVSPKGGFGNWQTTGVANMGDTYPYSLLIEINSFTEGDPNTMSYTVPSGMNTFTAMIGLDDDSASGSSVNFMVSPGGQQYTLGSDDRPRVISVRLQGERTLTLTVVGTKLGGASVPSIIHAVWGNAKFVP